MRNSKGQFVKGYTYKQTEEHKQKIGLANKGKIRSQENRDKISKARIGKFKGKNAGDWKGGRYLANGYVYIFTPNHPFAINRGYVAEHRLIVEAKIGRYLQKGEIIHHMNHNPSDNRIENLMILDNIEHNIIHNKGKRLVEWNKKNR